MSSIADIRNLVSLDILRDPNFRVRPQATVDRAINTAYQRVQQDVYGMLDADYETNINWIAWVWLYPLSTDTNFVQVVKYWSNVLQRTRRETVATKTSQESSTQTVTSYEYLLDDTWAYLLDDEGNFLTVLGSSTTTSPLVPTGQPTHYYITNGQVGLYPRPDTADTITVTYSGLFPDVSDTQALYTPSFLDTTIAFLASSLLFKQTMLLDQATMYENEYTKSMLKARMQLVKDENLTFWYSRSQ